METLYVALSAFAGGLASGALGWLRSGTPFTGHKFMASMLRSLLAGGAFATTYALVGSPKIEDIIIAFGAGAGVDVLLHRASKK